MKERTRQEIIEALRAGHWQYYEKYDGGRPAVYAYCRRLGRRWVPPELRRFRQPNYRYRPIVPVW